MIVIVLFSSNTAGVIRGAGAAGASGAPEFTPCFSGVRVARSLVFFVVFCKSLFVLLFFFYWSLSDPLYTASDYFSDNFKLFLDKVTLNHDIITIVESQFNVVISFNTHETFLQ
jgi:hypothetical protein